MSKQFDLEEFKAFVASKPADEEYQNTSVTKCALAQFGFGFVCEGDCRHLGIPRAVYSATVYEGPATFGALLDRLTK